MVTEPSSTTGAVGATPSESGAGSSPEQDAILAVPDGETTRASFPSRSRLVAALRPYKLPLLIAGSVYLLDGWVFHQGGFVGLAVLVGSAVGLFLVVLGLFTLQAPRIVEGLAHVGICLGLVVVTVLTLRLHNWIAHERAEVVIAACRTYEQEHGQLPESLDALVPDYLPRVPASTWALMFDQFRYYEFEGRHSLWWIATPPFGRAVYSFENDRWGRLD